ncbi:hypothetical protein NKH77_06420 [Streptomyces sp. M19]
METDALALVELADGTAASLALTSRGAPYVDETEVVMDRATLRVSATEGLFLLRDGTSVPLLDAGHERQQQALRAQLDGFVAAARASPARGTWTPPTAGRWWPPRSPCTARRSAAPGHPARRRGPA